MQNEMQGMDVIGAGRWGQTLIRNLAAMEVLGAIAEPCVERRRQLQGIAVRSTYAEHTALLAQPSANPVLVATPSSSHADIAAACLQSGRDVFVEKPMALSSSEATRLSSLAREGSRVLMVGHVLLYQPAVHFVREYLCAGKLGKVRRSHHDRLGVTAPPRAAAGDNVLWDLGVHDVALSLFLSGTGPERIEASGQADGAGVLEDVHMQLSYPGGVESWLHCSWVWPEQVRRTTIVGEAGVVVYDELTQTVTLYPGLDEPPSKRPVRRARVPQSKVLFRGDPQPVRRELEHFLQCVQTRQKPTSHAEHGVAVVEVLEEALAVASAH